MRYFIKVFASGVFFIFISLKLTAITKGSIGFDGGTISDTICEGSQLPTIKNATLPSDETGIVAFSWKQRYSSDNNDWNEWTVVTDSLRSTLVLDGLISSIGYYQFKRIDADDAPSSAETDPVSLYLAGNPTVSFTSVVHPNCAINSGAITASGSGGTGTYEYEWSNSKLTAENASLSAASYTVTVTDGNLCKATATLALAPYPVITLGTISATQPTCDILNNIGTGSISASATGGRGTLEYSTDNFSTKNTTGSFTGLAAGSYTVKVRDASNTGCTANFADQTINTITRPTASITINQQVSCEGSDGKLTASGSGGIGSYNYSWSNTIFTAENASLSAASYTVTVTDGNLCKATATQSLTPYPVITLGTISATQPTCDVSNNIGTGSISASATGGRGTLEYSTDNFSTKNTTGSFTGLAAGSYTVKVRDASNTGCTANFAAQTINTITRPTASITINQEVSCAGNDGKLTAVGEDGGGSYSYKWSATKLTAENSNLTAGTYTVTVKDANECTATASQTLNPYVQLINDPTIKQPGCDADGAFVNGSYTFKMTGGSGTYIYEINGESQPPFHGFTTISDLNAKSISLKVYDSVHTNCSLNYNNIKFEFLDTLDARIWYVKHPGCSANSGEIQASVKEGGVSPYTYLWKASTGISTWTTGSINGLNEGRYTLVVTDKNNCKSTVDTLLTAANETGLSITTVLEHPTCKNNGIISVVGNGGKSPYTFELYQNGESTPKETKSGVSGYTFASLGAGTYSVKLTDGNSCSMTKSDIKLNANLVKIDSISHITTSCATENVVAVNAINGTKPYKYSIDNVSFIDANTFSSLDTNDHKFWVKDADGCTASFEYDIEAPEKPKIESVMPVSASCFGGSDGSLTAAVSGGNPLYQYSWSGTDVAGTSATGPNSNKFIGLRAGTYNLFVTDSKKCTATFPSIGINQPTQLQATLALTPVAIFGESTGAIEAQPSGGTITYSYLWSNKETTAKIEDIPAGIYTVTITDGSGCQLFKTDTVKSSTQLSAGKIRFTTKKYIYAYCDNELPVAVESETGASGGTVPITYSWLYSTDQVNWDTIKGLSGDGLITDTIKSIQLSPKTLYIKRDAKDKNDVKASSNIVSITRNPLPVVSIVGLKDSYCKNDVVAAIYGLPASGKFTSTSSKGFTALSNTATVDPKTFDSVASVKYQVTDHNTCTDSVIKTVTIHDTVDVSIVMDAEIGLTTDEVDIKISPDSLRKSVLYGKGVYSDGRKFFPGYAELGFHTITFVHTDSYGCKWTTAKTVEVKTVPAKIELNKDTLKNKFCISDIILISLSNERALIQSVALSGKIIDVATDSISAKIDPNDTLPGTYTLTVSFKIGTTSYTLNKTIEIINIGTPEFIGLKGGYCENITEVKLSASQSPYPKTKGAFSYEKDGFLEENILSFAPSKIGGAKKITVNYQLEDTYKACSATISTEVEVYPLPSVSLAENRTIFNKNEATYEMTAKLSDGADGFFSINGNSLGYLKTFKPIEYGTGNYIVMYTATDNNSCTNSADTIFKVLSTGASLEGLPSAKICLEADSIKLHIEKDTLGGISKFEGTGISSYRSGDTVYFIPSQAGVGIHEVKYTYYSIPENGQSAKFEVVASIEVVHAAKPVIISDKPSYCDGETAVFSAKVSGAPQIGVFSYGTATFGGANAMQQTVNAPKAQVSFAYTDANGCRDTADLEIGINPLPEIMSISALPYYNKAHKSAKLTAEPVGGKFKSSTISFTDSLFDPSLYNAGKHVVTYVLTSNESCVSTKDTALEIVSPTVTFKSSKGDSAFCKTASETGTVTATISNVPWTEQTIGKFETMVGLEDLKNNTAKISPEKIVGKTLNLTFSFTSPDGKTMFSATKNILAENPALVSFANLASLYCTTSDKQTVTVNNSDANTNSVQHIFEINGSDTAISHNNEPRVTLTPSKLDAGKYALSYTYISQNNCISKTFKTFDVLSGTPIEFELKKVFNKNEAAYPLVATKHGSTEILDSAKFEGTDGTVLPGIKSFNPSRAIDSVQIITCTFTDNNGCISKNIKSTSVFDNDARFSAIDSLYCDNDTSFTITVSHARPHAKGRFHLGSQDIEGDTIRISPADLPAGINTLRYTYSAPDEPTDFEISKPFSVFSFGELAIGGVKDIYCQNSEDVMLVGTPSGGVFTVNDTSKTIFNPAQVVAGPVAIKYLTSSSFFQKNPLPPKTCRDSILKTVQVNALPVVALVDRDNEPFESTLNMCENDTLAIYTTLSGGVISGPSIFQDADTAYYTPKAINVDKPQKINLSYTDGNGCIGKDEMNITVRALPVLSIGGIKDAYCAVDDSVKLIGRISLKDTTAGEFSGKGISGAAYPAYFNPRKIADPLKPVTSLISYSYTNEESGCSSVAQWPVTVYPMPVVSLGGYNKGYCFGSPNVTLIGSHTGADAIYSINGSQSATNKTLTFTDSTVKKYNISFAYTQNGCKSEVFDTVKINPRPNVGFSISTSCAEDAIEFRDTTATDAPITTHKWLFSHKTGYSDTIRTTNASYKFESIENTKASLTVITDKGCTANKIVPLQLFNAPKFSIKAEQPCGNESPVLFTTKDIDTALYNFLWIFGDKDSSNVKVASHKYAQPGRYQASLQVDATGRCKTVSYVDVVVKSLITDYPHLQNFEVDETGWHQPMNIISVDSVVPQGTWQLAHPKGEKLNNAASGEKAWVTSANGNYTANEQSYIESPCFDIRGLKRPMLKFQLKASTQPDFDGMVLQISNDGGTTWKELGTQETGLDWYNSDKIFSKPGGQSFGLGWSGDLADRWYSPRIALDQYLNTSDTPNLVRFRFAFGSNGDTEDEGVVIDDFWIGERQRIVMAEQFVSASSALSSQYADDFQNYIGNNHLDVINLQYHVGSEGEDPFYAQSPQAANVRVTEYGISQVPYSLIDGNYFKGSTSSLVEQKNALLLRSLEDPMFAVTVHTEMGSSPPQVTVTVTALSDINTNAMNMHISLLEQYAYNSGGTSGQSEFTNIVRAMMPDPAGTALPGSWSKGEIRQFTYPLPLDSRYDATQLAVVAYVQDSKTKEVYQAGFDDYYVQKATGISFSPQDNSSSYYFFPNPASQYVHVRGNDLAMPSIEIRTALGSSAARSEGLSVYVGDLPPGMYRACLYDRGVLIKSELFSIEK